MLVQEHAPDGDTQAHGRLTLLGRAERVASEELPDARARYLARVPSAASYSEAHDFLFYRVSVEHVRYIGGFGKIFWLDHERFALDPVRDPLAKNASRIIEHMNEDHADALKLYCRAFKKLDPERATMVGVDQWGFDVECISPKVRLRFDFEEAATEETIRPVVVAMVRTAREILGESVGAVSTTP
jgi:putative heme iron utilization protein